MKGLEQKQALVRFLVFLGLGLGGVGVAALVLMPRQASSSGGKGGERVVLDTRAPATPQEMFHHRMEQQTDLLKKQIEAQGELLKALVKKAEMPPPPPAVSEEAVMKRVMAEIEQKLARSAGEGLPKPSSEDTLGSLGNADGSLVRVHRSGGKGEGLTETAETTLPAGSFVPALILGGVAASTSVTAAQNPRPVLLNLVDKGILPRGVRSDLKDCRMTAAAFGDLSSERVSVRLEKLSCVEKATGEVLEVAISGYVLGEDGIEGVKGKLSDRTGPLMRNSFVAGFFGGMAQGVAQLTTQNPLLSTPLGIQQPTVSGKAMMTQGAGKGAQGALEKYAEFYIKRAEQMQPVLYVAAGRRVDVVLTQGVSLAGLLARKAEARAKEGGRLKVVEQLRTAEPEAGKETSW